MGSVGSLAKAIFFPALISLTIYLLLSYLIIPSVRRYRERYSQYLPLHAISAHTSSLRERVYDVLMRFVLRVTSRRTRQFDNNSSSGSWFDEDGEEMDGFGDAGTAPTTDMNTPRRPRPDSPAPEYTDPDPGGRLSRELEQGFMDDSDDETHDSRQIYGRAS